MSLSSSVLFIYVGGRPKTLNTSLFITGNRDIARTHTTESKNNLRDLYKEISVCKLLQSTGTPTITNFKFNTELSPYTVVVSMYNT